MDKKELTKKNWALFYIPYGTIIHAITYIGDDTPVAQVRANVYISEKLARDAYSETDEVLSILSVERKRKPTVKAFIQSITDKYKFNEIHTSFEEMIRMDFQDTEDADIFINNSPILLALFEVIEV
jgi:hypothetical protein